MAAPERPKAYLRPPQASEAAPGQQSLFGGAVPCPDPEQERRAKRALNANIADLKRALRARTSALETVEHLLERGVTLPDVAEALGLPAPIERVTRPLRPWRLRRGSNMDVIATMLEGAGRKGVGEDEMVAALQERGRLAGAQYPRRSVHWTVKELQKRTRFVTQGPRSRGGRWYAYGRFDVWRSPAA